MSPVFVLPCGISILERMEQGKAPWSGPSRADAIRASQALRRWAQEQWGEDGSAIARGWRAEADRYGLFGALGLCNQEWKLLSAELASLVADGPPHRYEPGRDGLALLASDTPDGVLAAHLVAACAAARIEYLPQVDAAPIPSAGAGRAGVARILRIRGLVPTHTDRLREAAADIARALARARRTDEQALFLLHIAGGYKAAIPLFVGLAEYLPLPLQVWCKYEESEVAIRIPIRRLHQELQDLCRVLTQFDGGRLPGAAPLDPRWVDYAYEQDGTGGWILTPLGEALRALCWARLGPPPPAL